MKISYIGVIGGILAFISLALPWWTLALSQFGITVDVSLYLYKVTFMGMEAWVSSWFTLIPLLLIIVAGILGLVGGVATTMRKKILALGGSLALISIAIFAIGFLMEISGAMSAMGFPIPPLSLFGSGSFTIMGTPVSYVCYLSFGFWLALVASILMFVAAKRAGVAPPPPAPVAAPALPPPP